LPNEAGFKENNDEDYQQTPGDGDIPPASSVPVISLLYREIPVVRQYLPLCRREVQDIACVLAVFAERRQDRNGPYVVLRSVTLN
jgi:hypothetical protein